MNTSSNVWLVTGSGSGLGRNIAEAVLAAGHRLVATARDPRRLEDLVNKYGDQIRTAFLDVTDEKAAQASVQMAVDAFGRLDVVINNAGYGDIAPFEQLSSERFKALMDTNFYGVVNVTRAALPIMRKQRSGYIFQISSVGGRLARPGSTGYHAAKWAVGGFTESLAQEVAPRKVLGEGERRSRHVSHLLPVENPSLRLFRSCHGRGPERAASGSRPTPNGSVVAESLEEIAQRIHIRDGIGLGRGNVPGSERLGEVVLVLTEAYHGRVGKKDAST